MNSVLDQRFAISGQLNNDVSKSLAIWYNSIRHTNQNIPIDLFRIILEKSTSVIGQNKNELTTLHAAIVIKSKTVVEELLKQSELDVKYKHCHCNIFIISIRIVMKLNFKSQIVNFPFPSIFYQQFSHFSKSSPFRRNLLTFMRRENIVMEGRQSFPEKITPSLIFLHRFSLPDHQKVSEKFWMLYSIGKVVELRSIYVFLFK